PSIVVTVLPSAADTGNVHERTGRPSRWTVQAPQTEMPQPYFVPVRPSVSRSTHSSGISGSTSSGRVSPLTMIVMAMQVLRSDCSAARGPISPDGVLVVNTLVLVNVRLPASHQHSRPTVGRKTSRYPTQ